jgi:hypothetical protein
MRIELLENYYQGDEYRAKLIARLQTFQYVEKDPTAMTQFVVDKWAINPIDFIEQFGYIINPKFHNEVKPFFLFDYQRRILTKMWEAEVSGQETEILIDKPREMGLTWIMVWYYIWRWLFTKNWSGAVLSRTETEVDDGTADPSKSIFGKIRWSLQYLPEWIMPDDFTFKGKKGTSTDQSLRISNPNMMSSIVGSTANENAFRGSRFSFSWVDECFFVEHFQAVHRSISHVASTRVYISTSKVGRQYAKFVELIEEAGNHIQLTWRDNPFKDQIWYDEKMKEAAFDPEAIKEIDVSYAVNSTMQYYPELSTAKLSPVTYDYKRPMFISLDYGKQDHTVLIWWQFDGLNFNILECIARNIVEFDWFTPFMNKDLPYDEKKYVGYLKPIIEKVRSWNKPHGVFGEPAHLQTHYPSNTSIQKELRKYGVMLRVNNYAIQYEVRRKAVSIILPRCVFNSDSDGVGELYDALLNSRYAGNAKGLSKESMMKPAHDDEVGDYRSAFENGAANVPKVLRLQRDSISPDLKRGGTNNIIDSLNKYIRI